MDQPYAPPQSQSDLPPTLPQQMPAAIKIFGIIHIVYGGLSLLMRAFNAAAQGFITELSKTATPGMVFPEDLMHQAFVISLCVIPISALLVACGIGLLKRKLWARTGTFVWIALALIALIVETVVGIRMQEAMMGSVLDAQASAGEMPPGMDGVMKGAQTAGIVIGVITKLAYPVCCAIFLLPQKIRDALS
ncbi:MAG: hypothetical protein R3F11_29780 [Verrucomicrobiales bacterium]